MVNAANFLCYTDGGFLTKMPCAIMVSATDVTLPDQPPPRITAPADVANAA